MIDRAVRVLEHAVDVSAVRVRVGAPESGDGTLGVVVVERPRREQPGRHQCLHRRADGTPVRLRVPGREHQVERERLVELLVVGVLTQDVGTARRVRLGDEHQLTPRMIGLVGVDQLAPVTPRRMAFGPPREVRVRRSQFGTRRALLQLVVGEPRRLADHGDGVDAEPVDAAVEPEPQDAVEVVDDVGVIPVEIGLGRREHGEVPLTGRAVGLDDAGPRRAAEDGLPVVRGLVAACAATIAEVEPLAFGRPGRGRQRVLEPHVLRAAVVGDDVHHDPDAERACVADKGVELLEIAVVGLDVEVVGDVVPVVGLRRRVARIEPDRIDAEIGEVGQAAADAGEVADAVVVRVGERAHVQLVDDRSLPPRGVPSIMLLLVVDGMPDRDRSAPRVGCRRCPRRRSGRAAHDELERELFDERNRPGAGGERAGQDLRATLARHLQRLTHRRQTAVRGEVDVVVADDGHVVRHRHAGEPRRRRAGADTTTARRRTAPAPDETLAFGPTAGGRTGRAVVQLLHRRLHRIPRRGSDLIAPVQHARNHADAYACPCRNVGDCCHFVTSQTVVERRWKRSR